MKKIIIKKKDLVRRNLLDSETENGDCEFYKIKIKGVKGMH